MHSDEATAHKEWASPDVPLLVSLDTLLVHSPLRQELASRHAARHPLRHFGAALALLRGHPAPNIPTIAPATLSFRPEVVAQLHQERQLGRSMMLLYSGEARHAEAVSSHLGLFDGVLPAHMAPLGAMHQVPPAPAPAFGSLRALMYAARPHQWAKNLLIFLPLLAAHRYTEWPAIAATLVAFVVFSLAASAVYLLNDLIDVGADRQHHRKRNRPIASGRLGLGQAWIAWPLLLAAAFGLSALALPWTFQLVLAAYVFQTLVYSLRLKQTPMVDVLLLACLYTLRIIAGAAALGVPLSFWMLSFSMFFFLSLAFIKRFNELHTARASHNSAKLRGRGYAPGDIELVSMMGIVSGYLSVLVLALYIQDARTAQMYRHPEVIWLVCPLLLFWISRTWLIANRGWMHDDPIVFALKDRVSLVLCFFLAVIFGAARLLP
jgi:4-hydroxybenzoate polyprenyltransferase